MGKTLFLLPLVLTLSFVPISHAVINQSDAMDSSMNNPSNDSFGGSNPDTGAGGGMGSNPDTGAGGGMGNDQGMNNQMNPSPNPNGGDSFLGKMSLDERARYWHMQEEKLKQAEEADLTNHTADFAGWFGGIGIGYAHVNAATTTITPPSTTKNVNAYSGSGAQGDLFIGYGKVLDKNLKNNLYRGIEFHLMYNSVRMRTNGFKIQGGFGGAVLGRMGIILHKKFMPYFLLGVDVDTYRAYQPSRKNFNTFSIVPGLGMEYLLGKSFSARMEFKYSFGTAAGGISTSILTRKPRKSILEMGATVKF